MIKIVGLCGSRVKDGNMEALLEEALSHGKQRHGVETELITLQDKEIKGCIHCNWCVKKQTEGKFCSQNDDMGPIFEKLLKADGIILASPAHFGRLSGLLANMTDRTRVFVHGNHYGRGLKNKIGGALAVGFFRGGGIETTLLSINSVFNTLQMIAANSEVYQLGAAAVTSREGRFATEPRHIVLEDQFGVWSAKRLVDRMVELARIVKAGQEALEAQ